MTSAPGPGAAPLALELSLHPDDGAAFWRTPPLAEWRHGTRVRGAALSLTWHDGAEGELARAGRALVEQRRGHRSLWNLAPATAAWPPLAPPAGPGAPTPDAIGEPLPPALHPVAQFTGTTRRLAAPPGTGIEAVQVQLGVLRAPPADRPACRVLLQGAPREAFALARALAGPLRLAVPARALPAPGDPARPEAPVLTPGATPGEALAHLVAGLAQALLHWAPRVDAADPDPVHQMRVALRRLRSALKLFRRAAACPELDAALDELRALAHLLGPARDWDVFLGGIGPAVAAAFPAERAVARLLREARARRQASYATLVAGLHDAAFRRLGLRLAELAAARPWQVAVAAGAPPEDLRAYARRALRRRLRRVLEAGAEFSAQPDAALHAVRLRCKRLRYAAEFTAPLFPGRPARRYLRRVVAVQERLGRVNDGLVATHLLGELGGGAGRALAAGVVRGFVAAGDREARAKAEHAWKRFQRAEPFWA